MYKYIEWHRNPINKLTIAWFDLDGEILATVGETDGRAEQNIKAMVRNRKGNGYVRFVHMSPTASPYEDVPFNSLPRRSYRLAYYVTPKALADKANAAGITLSGEPIQKEKHDIASDNNVEVKEEGYVSETKNGYIVISKVKRYIFEGDIDYELTEDGKLVVTAKERVNMYPMVIDE